MFVTLLGMVMEVRAVQPANAKWSMFVTLFGMVIEVILVQPANTQTMDERKTSWEQSGPADLLSG